MGSTEIKGCSLKLSTHSPFQVLNLTIHGENMLREFHLIYAIAILSERDSICMFGLSTHAPESENGLGVSLFCVCIMLSVLVRFQENLCL